MGSMGPMAALGAFSIIWLIWYVIYVVQLCLSLGTAYRATKNGGDNGVALFGWLFVYGLASMIPGLGYYFWKKSR